MARPKVFVSHSHVDDAFAERLVDDLRAAGADAWLDKEDLGAGDFQKRISTALDACEWFVLVLTKSAIASPWVTQEVHAANNLKHQGRIRDLIFLKAGPLDRREVPALWNVYNTFDALADYSDALSRTLKALGVSAQKRPRLKPAGEALQLPEFLRNVTYNKLCPSCGAVYLAFGWPDTCPRCGAAG